MIKTVLFFVPAPFSQRDYDRYGMATFAQNGFEVFIWELTPFLNPEYAARVKVADPCDWDHVVRFESAKAVRDSLKRFATETFIFTTVPLGGDTLSIFRAISKHRIPYGVNVVNAIPLVRTDGLLARLRRATPRNLSQKLLSLATRRLPLSAFGIQPAAFVLVEGRQCSTNRSEVTSHTRTVPSNTLDYNTFLSLRTTDRGSNGTAVFIDNYLAAHPDFVFTGEDPPVTAARYHEALRRFFDVVEARLNVRVVVAAHPKSDYDPAAAPFGNREMVKGSTPTLVAKARLVLLNHSTAVSFAVLFRKPVVYLTSDEFEASKYAPLVTEWAKALRAPVVNIDRFEDLAFLQQLSVDADAYSAYRSDYISMPGAPERSSWQILCDELKTL